jgi:hypothetical protein
VTDGDCRFDQDIGGQSWTSYPPHHMSGFETTHPQLAAVGAGGIAFPRGHILHDQVDADVITFEMKSSNALDLEAVGAGDYGHEGVHRGD